jgi:hypothetical protein
MSVRVHVEILPFFHDIGEWEERRRCGTKLSWVGVRF